MLENLSLSFYRMFCQIDKTNLREEVPFFQYNRENILYFLTQGGKKQNDTCFKQTPNLALFRYNK